MKLEGPMFEPRQSEHWYSHIKEGAHYNIFSLGTMRGRIAEEEERLSMAALRDLFEEGQADTRNLCLFSTSGVHGMYTTIEEAEAWIRAGKPEYDEDNDESFADSVTFLVIQPRTVTLRYGNVYPQNQGDIDFLKQLRASSWKAVTTIGAPE